MSVLISQDGKVLVNDIGKNQALLPVQTGSFTINPDTIQFIKDKLNENNVNELFQFIPDELKTLCQEKRLIPTKASIFKPQADELSSQTRSNASQIPHINAGNELHFFFAGSHIIYFNINNQHYALIVQAGDWLFIPADVEHWIKETEDHHLVIVSYHSEPFDEFHAKVKYTATKSNAFL